jgi:hypothetical protein
MEKKSFSVCVWMTQRGESKRSVRTSVAITNPFAQASLAAPLPRNIVVTRASDDESLPLRPGCRFCSKDASNDADALRPCSCPTRAHVTCLDQRRIWSPERFSACEVCGWRYRFDKPPGSLQPTDDAEETVRRESCRTQSRRWCAEWVHGYWFIFILTQLTLVSIANILHAIDKDFTLAEWLHASMDDYTELEVDYAWAVCALGFVVFLVTITRHGCAAWPVMIAALPALVFCGAVGLFLSPFISFVLLGIMVVHAVHRMVQTDELCRLIYEWPVSDIETTLVA